MNSRLDEIFDWDERLQKARWRAKDLARSCEISERELREYVRHKFHVGLHFWIRCRRIERAKALFRERIGERISIKSVASDLGYLQVSHFSYDFKSFCGTSPEAFRMKQGRSRKNRRF